MRFNILNTSNFSIQNVVNKVRVCSRQTFSEKIAFSELMSNQQAQKRVRALEEYDSFNNVSPITRIVVPENTPLKVIKHALGLIG